MTNMSQALIDENLFMTVNLINQSCGCAFGRIVVLTNRLHKLPNFEVIRIDNEIDLSRLSCLITLDK